jgi:flagellar L-ring protein precursor FlgH
LPAAGPNLEQQLPTGSLSNPGKTSLFQDIKAVKVGDIITITVSEAATGSSQASTQTSRNKNFQGNFKFAGAGLGTTGLGSTNNPTSPVTFGPYQGQFANGFNGTGATSRADSMTAYMTATVVDVLPNGNLVIRGSRWTKVNEELQQIILEGVVRPMDITRNNTILSQSIAEAKIFLVGKGPVTQHQKPGWVGQLLDLISPF